MEQSGPLFQSGILIRRGQTQRRERTHIMTKAEIVIMHLEAKEDQDLLESAEAKRKS